MRELHPAAHVERAELGKVRFVVTPYCHDDATSGEFTCKTGVISLQNYRSSPLTPLELQYHYKLFHWIIAAKPIP